MSRPCAVDGRTYEPDYNRNARWCRAIVDELVRAGVRDAVLCPGGRSAALALQLEHEPALRTLVHTDERSGAFIALGIARVSGQPVAICTTSGSAVANLVPALCEAQASGLALVLLTCDRPRALRDAGAPQTMDQLATCAAFVAGALDLPDADDGAEAIERLRADVVRLLAAATLPGASGPVQLNVPLEGRFDSTEVDPAAAVAPAPAPAPRSPAGGAPRSTARGHASARDVAVLAAAIELRPGLRGLIVVGPDAPLSAAEVDGLARATGFPVLADAYTGLRAPAIAHVVCEAEALVFHPQLAAAPELLVRIGGAPLGQTVHQYLSAQACPVVRIGDRAVARDFLHPSFHLLERPDADALGALERALAPGDRTWLDGWLRCSARAREQLAGAVAALAWGECQAAAIACRADGFDFLHLGNSLPVRHGNLHIGPSERALAVYANRGVNGIDGTLGTFVGELQSRGDRGLLLVGDLATLHDLPALAAARADGLRGCVCVLANGGGALFDLLPCSRMASYERTVRNPPDVDLAAIAAAFGLPFARCGDGGELTAALADAAAADAVTIVEVLVPEPTVARELLELYGAMLA